MEEKALEEHIRLIEYLKTTYKLSTYERLKYLLITLVYQKKKCELLNPVQFKQVTSINIKKI